VFAAYVENQPVSCGWIYLHPGSQFAGLFGGSTLEEQRGQGLYQALLAKRAEDARRRGNQFLTTGAGPMSRSILERRGFQLLTWGYAYKWEGLPE
jgi:hypothetical protein